MKKVSFSPRTTSLKKLLWKATTVTTFYNHTGVYAGILCVNVFDTELPGVEMEYMYVLPKDIVVSGNCTVVREKGYTIVIGKKEDRVTVVWGIRSVYGLTDGKIYLLKETWNIEKFLSGKGNFDTLLAPPPPPEF